MVRVSASAAAKVSNWAPSLAKAAVSFLDSRLKGVTIRVAALCSRVILHVPWTKPSISTVPSIRRLLLKTPQAVLVAHDAGAVGMGEQQVIVLGQEARRGRGVRVGPRRVRHVEELVALLVVEGAQA